jgi:hypothetical protein
MEQVIPDQGQAGFDTGNAGPMNPATYPPDPMLSAGSPQRTRDVNEDTKDNKRNEPPPSKGPSHLRAVAMERGKAKHEHAGKREAARIAKKH